MRSPQALSFAIDDAIPVGNPTEIPSRSNLKSGKIDGNPTEIPQRADKAIEKALFTLERGNCSHFIHFDDADGAVR